MLFAIRICDEANMMRPIVGYGEEGGYAEVLQERSDPIAY